MMKSAIMNAIASATVLYLAVILVEGPLTASADEDNLIVKSAKREVDLRKIKHDGFRIIARKDGERVRLYSGPGNDLTDRFRLIVAGLDPSALVFLHHRRRGRGLGPSSTTLARRVPPLSQGPFNAQNFSEPLIISEPEISF